MATGRVECSIHFVHTQQLYPLQNSLCPPDEVPHAKEALEALEAYGMGPLFLRLQFVSATPPFLLMAPFQRAFGLGTVGVKY